MTMSNGLVRLCEESDLPALREREPHPDARFAEKHYALQQQGNYLFAVALSHEVIVGSCVLDIRPNSLRPELKNLWVYPEHRRQGAGSSLTRFLEKQAADQGFDEVFLGVDPDNYSAIPLYVDLGYSPTGHHREATYEWIDSAGVPHSRTQLDAVYRKSLLMRD